MKKISLLDVTNGLKRDEMRFIFGGSSNYGNSTSGGCGYNNGTYSGGCGPDECSNDSDCNCLPCGNGWTGFQKCGSLQCPGSSTQTRKTCRC